jgi:predicted RNA-binding protein with RPS1 domain
LGRLKHLLLFALLCSNLQEITAQEINSSSEKQNFYSDETVFLSTNATTFVTGETLYYKLNCLKLSNKTPSNVSKIAYVELVDSDRKTVFKNKIYLENTRGQGDYFVPTTIKTGNYKLIGYTNWMLNQTVAPFFQIDIVIINPFQTTENQAASSIASPNAAVEIISLPHIQTIQNDYLKLNLDKKTFSNREQVNIKLTTLNEIAQKGNYSFSVRKLDELPSTKQTTAETFSKIGSKIEPINKANKIILPELRGEMITGKISSKNNPNDIQNISIGLSIPGETFAFKVVKTDKNGNFIFNIDKPYYNSSINIQIIDENRSNYNIVIDSPSAIDYSTLSFQPNINLIPALSENLLNRSISSQIENAYYNNKSDSILKAKSINAFYEPIAKEYILDDYTRFPTLKETAVEIVKEMYYEKEGNNNNLHLRDISIYTQSPESALVLVDGLLLQNTNELFLYNMKNIYKISIVAGQYFLGPKAFNGIISFITKNHDFVSSQSGSYIIDASILRPTIKKEYFTPNYTDKAKLERIPDYRYQLLWLPEVTLASKETPISFYTSDVTGTFEISLEGFTDQGIPVSLKDTFEVQ